MTKYKQIGVTVEVVKGKKENIYNFHLRPCPNKPAIIDDDKELNEKIDEILKRHEKLKVEKKKAEAAFECPYCSRVYKSENLRHLLGCAQKNPEHEKKLQDFFAGV